MEMEKEAGTVILRSYGQFFKQQYQDYISVIQNDNSEQNKSYLPIRISLFPQELIPITELVVSDNPVMTKILSIFTSLCVEIIELKREAFERHFQFLALYDEYPNSDISHQMESICNLNAFVNRCNDTLSNIFGQVFATFRENIIHINGIQWHFIINHIGELFTLLVLTELLISRCSLPRQWNKFLNDIKLHSNIVNGINGHRSLAVNNALESITSKLMCDDIVQTTLQNLLAIKKRDLSGIQSGQVMVEITSYIRHALLNLEKLTQEKPNSDNMYKCIKINALFILNSHLFSNNDKKLLKHLNEINSKAHSIYIIGNAIWFPEQFLHRYAPSLGCSTSKMSQNMLKARQAYITSKKATIPKDIMTLQNICTQWVLTVEELFSNKNKLSACEMTLHAKTLIDGLEISSNLSHSVLSFITLHLSLGIPLTKTLLLHLFELIDILKMLKNAVLRNHCQILNSITMIIQHLTFQDSSAILEVKKSIIDDKRYANKRLDELTCIVIAEQAIQGAPTIERNIATNIALSFIPEARYVDESYVKLGVLLEKEQTLLKFMKSLDRFCNCSWILWHQQIIPLYFLQNFSMDIQALKLQYFLTVMSECVDLLQKTDKYFGFNKSNDFMAFIITIIEENVINNLSQNIETNLRLHIHSHLQLDVVNPLTTDMLKKILLLVDNLRLKTLYMRVVPSVEHYLSKTYYNLTTVVLSDWKTYGEMRQMAKFKFNLRPIQDDLPTQTLEQGLDVLEIMRNIHVFVSRYHYNLNNQIFIEKSSNNKHLNSINIKHIANSIRTHGTGIMNTTVNFTYQFLKNKFYTFSQFMYDEQIKSRLIKDLRHFKEACGEHGNMYPYKNADRFNKGIKVLGLAEDGQSYLDLFRDLITQIGNAMGYVRMIRSGGRHCCADATAFLHTFDPNKFKERSVENNFSNRTIETAEYLDESIDGLISNFIQGTEYFKLLVEVFAPVFRNPKNVHLKNFYIIVPPLILNFVEHMILSKDKMTKNNKAGAAFTDDGFAMGVAYVLKLLDQDSNFEALHWFDSIWNHIRSERELIELQKNKGSIQLQQALALSEKKLKTLEEEYKLLYYSLTSARIFFR
ncbi:WASH complex subunit 4 [Pieris napi]|uniref:WASH complex subunit 4 n=1 Tax=Pieris napi TaxID=78633 RepID=UPI001FBB4671|nr:WASH complex subunit 4 [Pieris napi]